MSKSNDMPEKMDLRSMDISEENRLSLKQLFPSVFTETCDEKGNQVESIDFERLKAELGNFSDIFESRRERYGMDWPGKKDALKLIQQPSVATLKPSRDESINFDTTENLFIEGDNLEVLKLLQKSYYGKVKMIYIDPPFNTGEQFIYPDKYSETLETYLVYAGLVDSDGKQFSTNTPREGRFHTKWLNMMYPRLYLARNLLREDGVIFISIDDNEVVNLRKLCDEIFGEECLVGVFSWKSKYGAGAKTKGFIEVHEYILCYAKNRLINIEAELTKEQMAEYNKRDDKYSLRGGYVTQPLMTKSLDDRENLQYEIEYNGDIIIPRKQWVWEKPRLLRAIQNNEVVFKKKKNGEYSVRAKVYLKDENGIIRKGKPISSLNGPFNQEGTKEVAELLGEDIFSFPKPRNLLRYLLSFIINNVDDQNGLYLDFFAGSGTTAHAVLDLNKEDGGNRKFIMVQLPEPCEENSEAHKAGYKSIADIGKERIRRVAKKIEEEQSTKQSDMFMGKKKELDMGFKVLKLDKSNFKIWEGLDPDASEDEIAQQLEMHIDHIDSTATQEYILFELLLKAGFMPTEKVEQLEMVGKKVFSVAEGALIICLEDEITPELVDLVAKSEPMQFICLDKGFQGNDQLKTNVVQTFAARNQGKDKAEQIVFRTV
jgi:adenine-specific DNA-methyltransferase